MAHIARMTIPVSIEVKVEILASVNDSDPVVIATAWFTDPRKFNKDFANLLREMADEVENPESNEETDAAE